MSGSQGNRGRLYIIRQEEPKHAGHHGGSWKVAYADFVTALMALFLLLWLLMALKPQQKESIAVYFQDPSGEVSKGSPVPTHGPAPDVVKTTTERQLLRTISGQLKDFVSKDPDLGKESGIAIDRGGVSIRIASSMLFQQGKAQTTEQMAKILQEVANVLKTQKVMLEVRGHTDDVEPVHPPYRSRWELSSARSATVINLLVTHYGIAPERLTAIGCADTQPLVPNDDEAGRAKNRRVEFFFSPQDKP